jgi:hypothetical protein
MPESFLQIALGSSDPERQDRVAQVLNLVREGEELSAQRRALLALLAVLTVLLLLALRLDESEGRTALVVIGSMAALSLFGVVRLFWLERRNQLLTEELVDELGGHWL